MEVTDPETPPTPAPSQIIVSFPNGVSTTRAELQLTNVDTVQVEIASSFLERVAKAQFAQAQQIHSARPGTGIIVPTGPKV